jgi:Leucine-rich repeat (LRR) protein
VRASKTKILFNAYNIATREIPRTVQWYYYFSRTGQYCKVFKKIKALSLELIIKNDRNSAVTAGFNLGSRMAEAEPPDGEFLPVLDPLTIDCIIGENVALVVRGRKVQSIDDIGFVTRLQKIDLSGNSISHLPPTIGFLENLIELSLGSNQICETPTELELLSALEVLDFGNNQLMEFPPICKLPHLRSVNLAQNQIEILPESISQMGKLEYLNMSGNLLASLSSNFGQGLYRLEKAYFARNQIYYLPETLDQATTLKDVDLAKNMLNNLPHIVSNMINLEVLNLDENFLVELPDLSKLTHLKKLSVSGNQLIVAPHLENTQLSLTYMNLAKNKIFSLPVNFPPRSLQILQLEANQLVGGANLAFMNSRHLRSLDLSANVIESLSQHIGYMTELSYLYLSHNQLVEIPYSISQLKLIRVLQLNGNMLTQLGPWIGEFKHLKLLNLSNNRLTNLPEELGNLRSLTQLDVSYNQLNYLPSSILQLRKLGQLLATDNPLQFIPQIQTLPLIVVNLQNTSLPRNLSRLFLTGSGNAKIAAISPHGTGIQLRNILEDIQFTVDYSGRNLSTLSNDLLFEIQRNESITTLDLSKNRLHYLPSALGDCEHLKLLRYGNNPLSTIPGNCKQSWIKLKSYLQSIKSSITSWNRCKLMLVGQEGVGKVSSKF